ncbi:MAG: GNAT family N-acetyltransferase [Oscillospiraceae bacterium]|nr:GNAT family N-acetyltransferase [Oscillospiraceae bacterium]
MIQIRLAQFSDAPELKKLNDLWENSNTVELIEKSIEENNREIVCVAAEINGNINKLVGFCCGQIMKSMCYSDIYGEITECFVTEKYRRQGIGKQLTELIEIEFNKRGVNHLHLLTGKDNLAAEGVSRSLGYVDISEIAYGSSSIVMYAKQTVIRA